MLNQQNMTVQRYLQRKEELLQQCIDITNELLNFIGDREQSTQLLRNRKQLLMALEQLDSEYAVDLSGYQFTEEDMETIAQLAETMWLLDEKITEAMRSNKDAIRQMIRNTPK